MASGFQTSDGVDLDSRYLGINAKAKSAATADTATTATKANALVNNRYTSKVAVVVVDLSPEHYGSKSWSAPSDGVLSIAQATAITNVGNTATVLGVTYGGSGASAIGMLAGSALVLKKGDSISTNKPNDDGVFKLTGKFFPYSQR